MHTSLAYGFFSSSESSYAPSLSSFFRVFWRFLPAPVSWVSSSSWSDSSMWPSRSLFAFLYSFLSRSCSRSRVSCLATLQVTVAQTSSSFVSSSSLSSKSIFSSSSANVSSKSSSSRSPSAPFSRLALRLLSPPSSSSSPPKSSDGPLSTVLSFRPPGPRLVPALCTRDEPPVACSVLCRSVQWVSLCFCILVI